nr:uncharacterized protein CTRU02_14087 [Colletotrichum truncatum]KAF6782606.1 hypothetical protein CTRU02_14087 [Colletotrichum truncatum]
MHTGCTIILAIVGSTVPVLGWDSGVCSYYSNTCLFNSGAIQKCVVDKCPYDGAPCTKLPNSVGTATVICNCKTC